MNSDKTIGLFLDTLAKGFPNPDRAPTELYFREIGSRLREVDLDMVKSRLFGECEFFPTMKKILEVVKHRREVERAAELRSSLEPDPNAKYTSLNEFFKKNNVASFEEYIGKKKGEA